LEEYANDVCGVIPSIELLLNQIGELLFHFAKLPNTKPKKEDGDASAQNKAR
jgi:hypothetical protein